VKSFQERLRIWVRRHVPNAVPASSIHKVREEFAELGEGTDAWELADCVIALWAHAIVCDLDLADAIERKLIQNEKRKWVVQPNGTVRWDRRFPVEL
jgi:NTP pyrophosphatase (non-canonical NTP hydrolase)